MSALVLRLTTAAGALAMTLALARMLGPEQFGLFAAMLSLATLAGAAATLGQNTAIQRLGDPAARGPGAASRIRAATIRATGTVTTAALVLAVCGLVAAVVLAAAGLGTASRIVAGAALLVPPLALAEPALAAAQMRGRLWLALAPRDIAWRLGLAVAALALAGRWHSTAFTTAAGAALGLAACVAVQLRLTGVASPLRMIPPRWRPGEAAFGRALAAVAAIAAASLSVVVLAAMLGPLVSGAFFAAQRIAQIAALPLHAARTAHLAPLAAAHVAGDRQALSRALAKMRRASVLPTLILGAAAVAAGGRLLGLFGADPGQMRAALAILAASAVVHALSGPAGLLMMLCGGHRALLRQTLVIEGLALAGLPIGVALAGPTGAALVLAGGVVVNNLAAISWSRRRLGVDPGIGALIWRGPAAVPVAPRSELPTIRGANCLKSPAFFRRQAIGATSSDP